MFNVSAEYKQKMLEPLQTRRITGVVGGVSFTDKDILKGSFNYVNKCVGGNDVHLGGVYVGELNLTFTKRITDAIERGQWQGKEISVSVGLLLDNGTWEDVPVGVFNVSEANWGRSGLELTCYDNMARFDKAAEFTVTSGSIYGLLLYCCKKCGVTLGMEQAEVDALVNGAEQVGLYPVSDVQTYRDIISWLAQTACCFATMDRNGALVLRYLGNDINLTIDQYHRKSGCTFSDFETYYSAITIEDVEGEEIKTYKGRTTTGLTMELGANPFLQYGTDTVKNAMRQRIIDKLADFRFTPFKCTTMRDIAFDLGDSILFTGMTAGERSKGCIMSIDYKVNGFVTLAGFGENPTVANAKNKDDKASAENKSKLKADVMSWLVYENVSEVEVSDERKRISSLHFGTTKDSDVDIWLEAKLNTLFAADSTKIKATITYVLDGDEISYKPVETWSIDEEHTLHYGFHFTKLTSERMHTLDVYLEMAGGTAIIAEEGSKLVLSALGLVKESEWDGRIEVEDSFNIKYSGTFFIPQFIEELEPQLISGEEINITTPFTLNFGGSYNVSLHSRVQIMGEVDLSNRVTEDGESIRVTEDGESYRVTEYIENIWAEVED